MSDLDMKLIGILNSTPVSSGRAYDLSKPIAQIKKAFIDEGWANFSYEPGAKTLGQEFYDRFEKELGKPKERAYSGAGGKLVYLKIYEQHEVVKAAQKASGIK